MYSSIITLIIGIGSIYFFYQYNFFLAVLLLIWTTSRLFGFTLQRLVKGVGESMDHSELEKECNVLLEFKIIIESVLSHKSVDDLFDKLKNNKSEWNQAIKSGKLKSEKIIKEETKEEWTKNLITNYKKKYKNQDGIEIVKFNIKNNLVWKNEKIDFDDTVYHEIFIPYEYKDGKEEEYIFGERIEVGLSIRVFVVNGIIKLQIGNFSKKYTPKMLKEGGLASYLTYETITSFPLIYFSYEHKIPDKYLNLSFYATEYHKNVLIKLEDKKNSPNDWLEINNDIKDYNFVCGVSDLSSDNVNMKKWQKIIKSFEEKKNLLLEKENFKNPFARDTSEDDYFAQEFLSNDNIYYQNKYLLINIVNFNNYKEKREKYGLVDYWEEMP